MDVNGQLLKCSLNGIIQYLWSIKMIELSQATYSNKLILGTALKLYLSLPNNIQRIESTSEETLIFYMDKTWKIIKN